MSAAESQFEVGDLTNLRDPGPIPAELPEDSPEPKSESKPDDIPPPKLDLKWGARRKRNQMLSVLECGAVQSLLLLKEDLSMEQLKALCFLKEREPSKGTDAACPPGVHGED